MLICAIIKPHALPHTEEILSTLQHSSISVVCTKELYFSDQVVHSLYDHMPAPAREAIALRLVGQTGLALLLDVPSIVRLLEVVGIESDPAKCAPGTIRERFGVHGAPALVGTDPWWENAIHRPIDMREAMRDLWQVFSI